MNEASWLTYARAPNPSTVRWLAVSRKRAFLTHLCASAAIVGAVCVVVFFVWYPHPYFKIESAWNPLRVLIGVDLVLGPAMTLMLFKPGKKWLLLDVAVIVAVQVAALVYGVTVIYGQRPYFTVFAVDRFTVLTRDDVDAAEWAGARARIGAKPFVGPVLAVAVRPTDQAGQQRLLDETLFGGKPDIDRRPEFWQPYRDRLAEVTARAKHPSEVRSARPDIRAQIDGLEARLRLPAQDLGLLPLVKGGRFMIVVIDMKSATPLEVIDRDPWEPN